MSAFRGVDAAGSTPCCAIWLMAGGSATAAVATSGACHAPTAARTEGFTVATRRATPCASCTPRKVESCGQCGLPRRVKTRRGDGAPICVNCYQAPKRTCCWCGLTAPTYAHTDEGPVCEACYPQPRRRCGGCGQVRPIDRRARGTEPDLCGRCITRPRRAGTICDIAHPAHPEARRPVCLACRDAGHLLEPDLTELPDRRRRRRHETAHDALRATLRCVLCDPDHGIAEQLVPVSTVYDHVSNPATTMQWLHERRGAAGLFGELAVRAHEEPITHELLDHYPQDQALHHLRDLLCLRRGSARTRRAPRPHRPLAR